MTMHDFLAKFTGKSERPVSPQASHEVPQGIKIEQLDLTKDVEQVAKLFADAFAGPPWNEYTKCGDCSQFTGKDTHAGDKCPHCESGFLSVAYPLEVTVEMVRGASEKPNATMYVAKQDEAVIGFTWGYSYPTIKDYFDDKSHYSSEVREQVRDVLEKNHVTW